MKTRDRLIEVARQLFLLKGIENTTISDIAIASENGRRTIYTYFKSKSEIYNAVVERESEAHVSELRQIVDADLQPDEKLRQFLHKSVDLLIEAPLHRDTLSAWLTLPFTFSRNDKIKSAASAKEALLLERIFREGQLDGRFDTEQCKRATTIFPMLMSASADAVQKNNRLTSQADELVNFMVNSVLIKKN
ncbi:MAG: TetR/AcrR family transcriptional regulator [Muribaculaceae bacterium]|nr:TetR/AcrR family transcriptional regulator [Muribaculaceae bacterium]MDE6644320.1 TetR/AcrR family transcriptional regulator [Muribaculaceae bacterium]